MIRFVRAMRFVSLFGALSFAPMGLGFNFCHDSHGLGRGLHSFAASRLPPVARTNLLTHSAYSIVAVIFALFSSMAETEQYFSFESFTASSIAFLDTFPFTTYFNLISV